MNDLMNISQIIRSASTIYIATNDNPTETSSMLSIQLLMNGKLYLGIPSDKPIYQIMKQPVAVTITTSKDGDIMQYTGLPIFEDKDEVSKIILENSPALKAIYSNSKKKRLKMFYLANASATISDVLGEKEPVTLYP